MEFGVLGPVVAWDDGGDRIRVTVTGRRYDGSVLLRYAYAPELGRRAP